MKHPKKVYLTLGGGLGDVYFVYKRGENGWNYLKSLKEKFPDTKVKVMCATHNPQTLKFIKHNPYIDTAIDYGWVMDGRPLWEKHRGEYVELKKQKKLLEVLTPNAPLLYLNNEDKRRLKSIKDRGKFVLLHPFAGEPHRRAMPAEEYIPLIDKIIEERNLNVVVIGASYPRTNKIKKEYKTEELDYERKGLINLIGKTNSRLCMGLAREQQYFIGSWSAYSCASWLYNKPTSVILQKKDIPKLSRKRENGRWRNIKCSMIGTEGPSHNPRNTDFNKIRRLLLEDIPNAK